MGTLQLICAVGLLLAASGHVSAAAGGRSGVGLAWGENYTILGNKDNHTWVCHFNPNFGNSMDGEKAPREIGGRVNITRCSTSCGNSTHNKQYLGYIGAMIAIICFGSNFVPVKKYETGDGVFYQWVMCIGIWLVGLVTNMILDSPAFFLPTVIGGFFWTTGNMLVVPIIHMIGLTMGLTVWGVTNMLSGWVVGRFILKQHVSCQALNYSGVATVVLSVCILAFVKSEGRKKDLVQSQERTPLLGQKIPSLQGSLKDKILQRSQDRGASSPTSINSAEEKVTFSTSLIGRGTANEAEQDESWTDKLGVWPKRILGFSLSLVAGMFFSLLFLPVQFLKLCEDEVHSCKDMDYLFGVFSGILLTSTTYFVVYAVVKGNWPKVYPKVIFPGIISGLLWGIAMAGWFLANQYLSTSISFPIVTAGPGFISSLWGIIVYREIKGWKNLVLFFIAFLVSLAGQVMNGLSQCTHCGH